MTNRIVHFEGIDNFRNYGGYAVTGGGRLREGLLYRSAKLTEASPFDLETLGRIGLVAVIDLRGPSERAKAPSRRPEGFSARLFEPDVETGGVPPHLEAAVKGVENTAEARAALQAVYADMPCRPVVIAALRGYFRALAATDGPSLIHCAAGKDRTGVAVALFHTALGVHRDDIMADYLLTNVSGRPEQRVAAAMAAIRTLYGERLDEDAAHALVSAAPDYLEAAFAGIERGHGSVEAYLRDVLGVDAAWHEAAARRLIV